MEVSRCLGCMQEVEASGPCPHCGFKRTAYTAVSYHLPPETILNGRYLIGRVLYEDKYGITYVGWDLNLELKLSVREYYPEGYVIRDHDHGPAVTVLSGYRSDFFATGLDKFMNQAKELAKFWQMPGIVSVRDYFQANGTAYMVQAFIEGELFEDVLKRCGGRMTPEAVFKLMRPVLETLMALHAAGIFHRNICPQSLMVDSAGQMRLVDFEAGRSMVVVAVALKPGDAAGFEGNGLADSGTAADIYGLCAVMYAAVTGVHPPNVNNRTTVNLQSPVEMGIVMLKHQEAAMMRGMSAAPKQRQTSVNELYDEIYEVQKDIIDQTPDGQIQGSTDTPVENRLADVHDNDVVKKKGSGVKIGIAVGVIVAIALLCIMVPKLTQKDNAPPAAMDLEAAVDWKDPNMERLVRDGLGQATGDIKAGDLAGIRMLSISGNQIELSMDAQDFPTPGDPEDIPKTDYIVTLEDLNNFPNLEKLRISGHKIQDMEAVGSLANLTLLILQDDALTDIQPLAGMKQLTTLTLNDNKISDITPLSGLTNLKMLNIRNNGIKDITPLSGLIQLTSLNLNDNSITDIGPLSTLTELTVLNIRGSNISSLSPLAGLEKLTALNLRENVISDISYLAGLTKLKELYLNYNSVSDVAPLTKLKELEILALNDNGLKNITPLSKLEHLKELYLHNNEISDVEPLAGLTQLRKLSLEGNPVTDVSALEGILGQLEEYTKP